MSKINAYPAHCFPRDGKSAGYAAFPARGFIAVLYRVRLFFAFVASPMKNAAALCFDFLLALLCIIYPRRLGKKRFLNKKTDENRRKMRETGESGRADGRKTAKRD
ncbi:MAG: hypothetical protein SPH68_01460 [Candidatus Borkfalkiaceae bacterium]|nr:hypothetical protein [Clostridia bacterium]MDY6222812.1 hypothetical protein [Christensenellaceae bacterium]